MRGSAPGLLVADTVGATSAFDVLTPEVTSLVSQPFLAIVPFVTGADGLAELPVALAPGMAGDAFALQAWVLDPSGLAASAGLELVVGP